MPFQLGAVPAPSTAPNLSWGRAQRPESRAISDGRDFVAPNRVSFCRGRQSRRRKGPLWPVSRESERRKGGTKLLDIAQGLQNLKVFCRQPHFFSGHVEPVARLRGRRRSIARPGPSRLGLAATATSPPFRPSSSLFLIESSHGYSAVQKRFYTAAPRYRSSSSMLSPMKPLMAKCNLPGQPTCRRQAEGVFP